MSQIGHVGALLLGLNHRRIHVHSEIVPVAPDNHLTCLELVDPFQSLKVLGLPQPLTDGVGPGQPGKAAELFQPLVQLNLPDVFHRPAATAEHHDQGQHILLGLKAIARARWR